MKFELYLHWTWYNKVNTQLSENEEKNYAKKNI
ncbi:Uncharacterised protein [Streptococcus massiliensis]|uniref:Uncharacterized protein n=1 Tax=Streptococcus massiliensis TaxID=313439 RepID=A0A380KW09_9STRE|nr:Uncharacterised protein [Streptococcus massiliensis]